MKKNIIASIVAGLLLISCFIEPEYDWSLPTESLVPFDSSALDTATLVVDCETLLRHDDFDGSEREFEDASNIYYSYAAEPYLIISNLGHSSWFKIILTNLSSNHSAAVTDFYLKMNDGSGLYEVSSKPTVDIVWYSTDTENIATFRGEVWGWNDGVNQYDTVSVSGTFCFE